MNRLSMELSELALDPGGFDEETWLIEPPGMDTDENAETKTPQNNEEEDLDQWLQGAVKKVDFRTRSALSRRLEKKKLKREKRERLHGNTDKSLTKIEETGDRDEPWLNSSPSSSTHKNSNKDLSCNESDTDDDEFYFEAEEQIRQSKELYYTPREYDKTLTRNDNPPRRNVKLTGQRSLVDNMRKMSSKSDQPNGVKNVHMSELERKAKEQEQELRMELMNRRDRLFVANGNDSRPNSASSSASSSVMNMLATSKSVDFRSSTRGGSSVSSSHSNEGSMNDLNRIIENRTPTLNSRLPLPRRPAIPGKTGIPLPTPKSSKTLGGRNGSRCSDRAISLEVDDECF